MSGSTTTGGKMLIVGAAIALTLTLGGCGAITNLLTGGGGGSSEGKGESTEKPSKEPSEEPEAESSDVFEMKVGDCLNTGEISEETDTVPIVSCDQPHDDEIYHEFTLPKGDFPGDESIEATATEKCVPAFEKFVGISYDESALDWYQWAPTADSWDQLDDRVVQCAVYDPTGQTTGTLKGAAH